MRRGFFILAICALPCPAQTIDYACIPRFRADPGIIQISEASGGQPLLLSPKEIGDPIIARAQMGFSNPSVLRASGTLTGRTHEFTAPVDSTVRSLQFTVFAECVKSVTITAPSGAAAEGVRFSTGRIVILDEPEQGTWTVKLSGTGYFSAVAQVKSSITLGLPHFEPAAAGQEQRISAAVSGAFESPQFELLARDGRVLQAIPMERLDSGFQGSFTTPPEPFRIAVEGKDTSGAAFRRVHAPLFTAASSPSGERSGRPDRR